jgi:hypothetical protein
VGKFTMAPVGCMCHLPLTGRIVLPDTGVDGFPHQGLLVLGSGQLNSHGRLIATLQTHTLGLGFHCVL